jgi:hypothetical protein
MTAKHHLLLTAILANFVTIILTSNSFLKVREGDTTITYMLAKVMVCWVDQPFGHRCKHPEQVGLASTRNICNLS